MTLSVGKKLGFCLADYAKLHHKNIGNIRLKDGSSLKVIGCQESDMIEIYRVKHNKLYGGSIFKGEDSIFNAAQEFCAITEKHAVNPEEADKAWGEICKFYHPDFV